MEDVVLCDTSSVFGATCLHFCKPVPSNAWAVLQAATGHDTARMKHCMQDAATDLGVELPLTKLQDTASMKEGVPRLKTKAAVTRHTLRVNDHDRRVHLCLRCLCLVHMEFYSWSWKRSRQRARERNRKHLALHMSLARDR